MFASVKSLFLNVNFGLNQLSLSKILIFIPFIIVEILFQLLNRLSNFRLRLPCFFLCLLNFKTFFDIPLSGANRLSKRVHAPPIIFKPLNVTFPTYPFSIICPFCFRSGLILYLCVFSSFFSVLKKLCLTLSLF